MTTTEIQLSIIVFLLILIYFKLPRMVNMKKAAIIIPNKEENQAEKGA